MFQPKPARQARAFWPMMALFAVLIAGYGVAFAQTGSLDQDTLARGTGRALAEATNAALEHPQFVLGALVAWLVVPRLTTPSARSRRS